MRRFTALCCSLLAFVALTGFFHHAWSQEVTASITGTITDPSGAAVAGATVTATSQERGQTYTGTTNESGLYRIAQLPVGSYAIKVEKAGFALASVPPFVLTLNQVARIDVGMKVGKASETVEVTGAAPVLKTETTQVDTIINAATNDNMPLASRNYVQLTLLAPGAVSTDPSSFSNGNNTGGYGGRPLINGNREQANNFLLDGMDNNQVSDNLLGYTPAPDAIEEFNLITSNAPAEFGNFEGGIVNAVIKSGTNKYHGDIWEFFRNDVLNANSWSNNLVYPALPKAKLRWNMFGGTVGGPILRNKLFFFADFQDQRFDFPSSSSFNTVFTSAERGGDFGILCTGNGGTFVGGVCTGGASAVQLYNPCASFTAPCTPSSAPAVTRQPFANNVIPTAMMSPVAGALFGSSLYPSPVNSLLQNNAVNVTNSAQNVVQGDLKIDFKATQKDNISYRFTRAYQDNPAISSQALLSNTYSTTPIYNTVGDWSRTIGNNLLNDARIGWSHITLNSGNSFTSGVGQFGNTLGIGNGNPGSLPGLLAINFSNSAVSNLGAAEQTQSFDDHVWQFEDAVSWTHGRHNFKFGGQWWRQNIKTFYAGNNGELGLMDFNGQFTNASSSTPVSNTGDGGADFFLGLDYQYGRGVSTGQTWQQTSNVIGIYAQDTWQVTPRLTWNLGLRYDAHSPWVEANNHQANYNFTTGNIDLAGQNGASKGLYDGTYGGKDFQPRIGFAWTPAMLGDHTVIRGAFTISSYMEGTGTNLRLTLNPPFTPAEINANYSGQALPTTDTTDGIVGSAGAASCAAPAYACYAGDLLRVWDPKVQPAIADQWNFTVQHQFAGNTTVQVGYVGQRGTHLMVPFDYAQRVLLPNSSCATPPCTADSPYFAANPDLYSALGNGGPGATVSGTKSNGTMRYNSLQAVVQKQMTHGLQYQVAYTLSKCMSDSTGYYGAWNNALSASAYWQNVYDQKSEYAPCYYDATHVVSAYAIYDLPFGRGKMLGKNSNAVINGVIGNWQVSPIVSFHTGWPLPVYGAQDESGTFGRGARADCSGVPSIANTFIPGIGRQWFNNTGQFTNPSVGTFGNCSPQLADLRSPHYSDVDLSLHKDFPITERFRLQFRTDFVNAFNHVQLNAPNMGLGSTMGQITSAQPPRNIQLALKLYY